MDEVTGRDGQARVIEEVPESGVRVCDAGDDHLIFREAVEFVAPILVDFCGGRR